MPHNTQPLQPETYSPSNCCILILIPNIVSKGLTQRSYIVPVSASMVSSIVCSSGSSHMAASSRELARSWRGLPGQWSQKTGFSVRPRVLTTVANIHDSSWPIQKGRARFQLQQTYRHMATLHVAGKTLLGVVKWPRLVRYARACANWRTTHDAQYATVQSTMLLICFEFSSTNVVWFFASDVSLRWTWRKIKYIYHVLKQEYQLDHIRIINKAPHAYSTLHCNILHAMGRYGLSRIELSHGGFNPLKHPGSLGQCYLVSGCTLDQLTLP